MLNVKFIILFQHNFKKVRNNIEKSNESSKPRCLTVGGKKILWSQLVKAYQYDQNQTTLHIHEKLTEQHFQLDPASKMRNQLAEDVLDKRMHYLMQVLVFHCLFTSELKSKCLVQHMQTYHVLMHYLYYAYDLPSSESKSERKPCRLLHSWISCGLCNHAFTLFTEFCVGRDGNGV